MGDEVGKESKEPKPLTEEDITLLSNILKGYVGGDVDNELVKASVCGQDGTGQDYAKIFADMLNSPLPSWLAGDAAQHDSEPEQKVTTEDVLKAIEKAGFDCSEVETNAPPAQTPDCSGSDKSHSCGK